MDKLLATSVRQPSGVATTERVNTPPSEAGKPLEGTTKSKPSDGKSLPVTATSSNSSAAASDPKVLEDAVQKVNDYAKAQQRAVRFAIDQDLGRPVVKVVDNSDVVVRQIPSEVVIRLARNLEDYQLSTAAKPAGSADRAMSDGSLLVPGQVINTNA